MTAEHRYELFIHAPRERVWAALIEPEFTQQYFHGVAFQGSLTPGSRYVLHITEEGADAIEGIIEVFEPPARLAYTWHVLYNPAMTVEPPSRVEFVLREANEANTVTRVTLIHGGLADSPLTRAHARLGWVGILDNLKSLLETGAVMPEFSARDPEG
jgi:uncharacterized protein YndB with AHSA1/START domain